MELLQEHDNMEMEVQKDEDYGARLSNEIEESRIELEMVCELYISEKLDKFLAQRAGKQTAFRNGFIDSSSSNFRTTTSAGYEVLQQTKSSPCYARKKASSCGTRKEDCYPAYTN